jgi:hypothetical protein
MRHRIGEVIRAGAALRRRFSEPRIGPALIRTGTRAGVASALACSGRSVG